MTRKGIKADNAQILAVLGFLPTDGAAHPHALGFPQQRMSTRISVTKSLSVAAVLGALGVFQVAVPGARQARAAESPPFVELEDTGFDFDHFNGASGKFYMAEINGGGGGMIDYDNDGDLDLYLVQGEMLGEESVDAALFPPGHPLPLTDRLYRNDLSIEPDGTRRLRFTDMTEHLGVRPSGYGYGLAAGDYDNDGWIDLYVTRFGANSLLHNNGDGSFSNVTRESGTTDERWSVPAVFTDYDADGWLDLLVGNYLDFDLQRHKLCRTATGGLDYCGPSAYPGVFNRLYRNRGDGTFENVTAAAGLERQPSKTLGVVAADFNGDSRLDFYVANDLAPNEMWIQQTDGRFLDEALLAGTAVNASGQAEASMGVDAGDFDGDGDIDLFMTHLTTETNTFFANDGSGLFEDATIASGLGPPSWAYTSWGTGWLDFDNDGWLDLMVANGAVRVIEELANRADPYPFHQPNQLFRNLGGGRFEDVTAKAGPVFERSEVSRAIAVGDLDNDGDADALIVNNVGPARILLNTVGAAQHWIGVRLVGLEEPRDALGARLALLRRGKRTLWRRVQSDGSFAAARDPRVVFGLGRDTEVDPKVHTVRAYWPDGRVEEWSALAIDRYTSLRQGTGRAPR